MRTTTKRRMRESALLQTRNRGLLAVLRPGGSHSPHLPRGHPGAVPSARIFPGPVPAVPPDLPQGSRPSPVPRCPLTPPRR